VDFVDGVADFGAVAFPTVKYLRIISSDFPPSPHIASKSSTLLNPPTTSAAARFFFAVAGPIPGTRCSSSAVAEFEVYRLRRRFFLGERTSAEK